MPTSTSIHSGFREMIGGEEGGDQREPRQTPIRIYVYQITVDNGVALCVPPVEGNLSALLTLAICESTIRRTAKPSDRILGIINVAIAASDGNPLDSIIYFAMINEVSPSQNYFTTVHKDCLECIYSFDKSTGQFTRLTTINIHESSRDWEADLRRYPLYKNGWVLVCREFRYFGKDAVRIPNSAPWLLQASQSLRQSHRVCDEEEDIWYELEDLINDLRVMITGFTPKALVGNARRSVLERESTQSPPLLPRPRPRC